MTDAGIQDAGIQDAGIQNAGIQIVYLCTGNAARSVMATTMSRAWAPELTVWGAGTFSIEGLPMSSRTRDALAGLDLADPGHRSHQLVDEDVDRADLIVCFEPQHIDYVRRKHPDGASKTATLKRLVSDLAAAVETSTTLGDALATMDLADATVADWEEVIDPAGGELADFVASAEEIKALMQAFLPIVANLARA